LKKRWEDRAIFLQDELERTYEKGIEEREF